MNARTGGHRVDTADHIKSRRMGVDREEKDAENSVCRGMSEKKRGMKGGKRGVCESSGSRKQLALISINRPFVHNLSISKVIKGV